MVQGPDAVRVLAAPPRATAPGPTDCAGNGFGIPAQSGLGKPGSAERVPRRREASPRIICSSVTIGVHPSLCVAGPYGKWFRSDDVGFVPLRPESE
jgi:hypothetical protein